jgi:hypothetical protein
MSTLFLLAFIAMIVVYAWKSPNRVAAFQEPPKGLNRPAPEEKGELTLAEFVLKLMATKGLKIEDAAKQYNPVVIHRGLVSFNDGSTLENTSDGWKTRRATDAEYAMALMWHEKMLRSEDPETVKFIEDELDDAFGQYDEVTKTAKFKDGTSIFYNSRIRSWTLGEGTV